MSDRQDGPQRDDQSDPGPEAGSRRDRLDEAFADIGLYDRQGRRIRYFEYSRLREDLEYRFVARDRVGDMEVVTAWLGVDQGDGDPPWIFGTVTLSADGGLVDDRELFATTETEALRNHAEVLARRRAQAGAGES